MRFPSKVDGWLVPVLLLAFAGVVAALIGVLIEPTPWPARLFTAVLAMLVLPSDEAGFFAAVEQARQAVGNIDDEHEGT